MSISESAERAAALLERLLSDPAYRSEFRADPARACADEGLPEVAAELGRGRAMQTLEIRESRSSLAGVLMAAALEGASLAVLVDHAEAAGSVDPTAASALAQLTQNHQAVAAPAIGDPPPPVDVGAPAAVDPSTVAAPPAAADATLAAPAVDPVAPPPVADPPPPVEAAPAVDVIDSSSAAQATPGSVQFLPAVSQTDPATVPATTPVEPLAGPIDASAAAAAPAPPVTGVLQSVAQQQSAAVQSAPTVGALPAVPAVADHVDALAVVGGGPNPYPGDNAGQPAIAAWMARDAQAAGLPPELPVMASLVESGLTNMPGGDRDSMGFFQMRAGIWDRGEYAGYSQNPELQMKWFIDHALAIKAKRIAEGDATYGQDPSTYGNWVADIEVPYEPYRGRYQLRLGDAQSLLANVSTAPPAAAAAAAPVADAAVASTPIPAADISGPVVEIAPGVPVMDAQAASPTALAAIKVAAQYVGTSYHFGGASPETGFDCSGLMQWAYSHAGVSIPRVTYDQIDVGAHVDRAQLVPGDLIFFQNNGDVHHVGMYLGGGRFLHAPHTGDVVKVSSLDEPYYAEQFAGGRRMA
ncbi:MAG: peptidoglycan DL-endopeptidase CwlO [Thermoleophilales bacterium]|nr:peptidoglycan DL-endopeptidase CwlO [Thermoleophilales bacterium]